MIAKQDILDRAAEWHLPPEVVEKDYVLGWLLAALATLPVRALWVFKGGTCVKKCFFETYRFSEDLDFSLRPEAPYTPDDIVSALRGLTEAAAASSGLEFPPELVEVKPRQNKQGELTFEGRIAYRGPLAYPGHPKIRFDLTRHEAILSTPIEREILHPYPDGLPAAVRVLTYAFEELVAEKTRALAERSRPRDLYDVVHLLENAPADLDYAAVRRLFREKCAHKRLTAPSATALTNLVGVDQELRSEWSNMLAHQLPALPDLDAMLSRLPAVLGWLDDPVLALPERRLPQAPAKAGFAPIRAAGIQYWGRHSPLETIRFAATNRLRLAFDYHGQRRLVEPYTVRQAATGNVLLGAWELASEQLKNFKLDEMERTEATGQAFSPRYQVEISAHGPIPITPPSPGKEYSERSDRARLTPHVPVYVFECPICQKRFRHRSSDGKLRAHKNTYGQACSGRRGYLVSTLY